jgi:hypothetical protein
MRLGVLAHKAFAAFATSGCFNDSKCVPEFLTQDAQKHGTCLSAEPNDSGRGLDVHDERST